MPTYTDSLILHPNIRQSFPWTNSHECGWNKASEVTLNQLRVLLSHSSHQERERVGWTGSEGRSEREFFHMVGRWIMVNMISHFPIHSWVLLCISKKLKESKKVFFLSKYLHQTMSDINKVYYYDKSHEHVYVHALVCVSVCVCMYVCVCVRACACLSLSGGGFINLWKP
jgi:hypothetical protein